MDYFYSCHLQKAAFFLSPATYTWTPELPELRSQVPGTMGSRNGDVGRGSPFFEAMERGGYTSSYGLFDNWNAIHVILERQSGTMVAER